MIQIVKLYPQPRGCVHPDGFPIGLTAFGLEDLFENIDETLKMLGPSNTRNIFYTLAHHSPLGQSKPTRTKGDFDYQDVLHFDIDYADESRALEYAACLAQVLGGIDTSQLTVIWTGNGLHVLAFLKTPLKGSKAIRALKPAYNELCRKLQTSMRLKGLIGTADVVVWDEGRIFRLPGTLNVKPSKLDTSVLEEKKCYFIQKSRGRHALDLEALAGLDKIAQENISHVELRRQYPLPDFAHVVRECRFLGWALEKPEEVHEPQAFAAFSLFGAMAPMSKVVVNDKEYNGRELARTIFEGAVNSKSCQAQDFDRKWEDSTRYGAQKCQTVSQTWPGGCEKCPHHGKIVTPLQLKSAAHISSEENGYWVRGKNGQPIHPHYSDLAKIYIAEQPVLTTGAERIWIFDGKKYEELQPVFVKAWLERKMVPNEAILSAHRSEFFQKILVTGAASPETEKLLFTQSIQGKLNCSNGVLDIVRGELLPHSPNYGFQYVLPYEYREGESSEYFLNWLSEVMEDRVELMEAVLDVMAYCLWPTYEDHIFTYFVGEGQNGKSTLLEIIQTLIGFKNFTAVSLTQLAQNRFAPADLEGKLANLCEESSGSMLTFEEMNVIKALSAGGMVRAERKNQPSFEFPNRAKLLFSANKVPQFKDQGLSIKRRMLVIPFDRTFAVIDPSIKDRLLSEVPAICSMLVKRLQEKVKMTGKFMVSRGGAVAAEAQEKVLLSGNSVIEWAKECLESSIDFGEGTFIEATTAFSHYSRWCQENNFTAMNKIQCGMFLSRNYLTPLAKVTQRKVSGKNTKIYPYTRWKEGVTGL